MKKLVLALTAVAAFSAPALAADLAPRPYAKAAPLPVAVANWTGCYIAGGGGYGMWNQENTLFDDESSSQRFQVSGTETSGGRGWFGTVQGGCDYQFAAAGQQWVIGADGAYYFSNIKGNVHLPDFNNFVGS